MSHYDETRNRFNPDNRFIGDIEDGKKYPFSCYTKEESDARYLQKSEAFDPTELEAEVAALSATVATKASNNDLLALAAVVDTKANTSDLTAIYNRIANLETAVSQKANESECVEIRARLDALESDAIRISMFKAEQTNYEKGQSATISLSWSLNKVATSQKINNVSVEGSTHTYTNVTDNQSYTLEVSDGRTIDSKTVEVAFQNRIYYGAAPDLSSVNQLASVLSDDITRRITVTAGAGQYIIYAFPSRLGSAEFYVDNFEGGFSEPEEQVILNAYGYSETYKVYKSTNANLGTTTVDIKEV